MNKRVILFFLVLAACKNEAEVGNNDEKSDQGIKIVRVVETSPWLALKPKRDSNSDRPLDAAIDLFGYFLKGDAESASKMCLPFTTAFQAFEGEKSILGTKKFSAFVTAFSELKIESIAINRHPRKEKKFWIVDFQITLSGGKPRVGNLIFFLSKNRWMCVEKKIWGSHVLQDSKGPIL